MLFHHQDLPLLLRTFHNKPIQIMKQILSIQARYSLILNSSNNNNLEFNHHSRHNSTHLLLLARCIIILLILFKILNLGLPHSENLDIILIDLNKLLFPISNINMEEIINITDSKPLAATTAVTTTHLTYKPTSRVCNSNSHNKYNSSSFYSHRFQLDIIPKIVR